jgi:peptide/nickel transport system permease protein
MTPTSLSSVAVAEREVSASEAASRPSRLRGVARQILKQVANSLIVLWGAATVAFFAQASRSSARPTSSRRS